MVRNAGRLFLFSLISMMSCLSVFAQSTAQLSGTVRDQSGAVLPGVEVTATQTATGLARTVLTNETGSYVLPNLPIGPYRLEAALPGFRMFVQTGIVLQVSANPEINIVMAVGQVAETVEVQADAALVETRNTGVGQVIDNVRVMELPLRGIIPPTSFRSAADPTTVSRSCWTVGFITIRTATRPCPYHSPMRCRNSKSKPALYPPSMASTRPAP